MSTFLPVINNKVSLLLIQSHSSTCFLYSIFPHLEYRAVGYDSQKHAISLLAHPVFTLHWIITANIQTCFNSPYLSKIKEKKRPGLHLNTILSITAKYLEPFKVTVSTPSPNPQLHTVYCTQPTPNGSPGPLPRLCLSKSPATST